VTTKKTCRAGSQQVVALRQRPQVRGVGQRLHHARGGHQRRRGAQHRLGKAAKGGMVTLHPARP
jgi:hypothetical protein